MLLVPSANMVFHPTISADLTVSTMVVLDGSSAAPTVCEKVTPVTVKPPKSFALHEVTDPSL